MTISNTPWFKNPAWYGVIITGMIPFMGMIAWAFNTTAKLEKTAESISKIENIQELQGKQIQETRLDTVKFAGEVSTIKEILIRLERKLDRKQ